MGVLRAALMLVKPRKSLDQRIARSKFNGQQLVRRMANDQALSQPSLAAELRLLAGRD
jgi:adenosine/AMP kinase